jgi:signal transduction histidine kinase
MDRLVTVARLSCAAGILVLTLTVARLHGLPAALLLCAAAAAAAMLQARTRLPAKWVAVGEAAITGMLIGSDLPSSAILLPYLLIPLLAAGCAGGPRAVVWASLVQSLSLQVPGAVGGHLGDAPVAAQQWSPWLLTALGIGLLGARLRAGGRVRRGDDVSYEAARKLIGQLRSVAGRLPAGLDLVGMGEQILGDVDSHASAEWSILFVRAGSSDLVPLARNVPGGVDSHAGAVQPLAAECLRTGRPAQRVVPSAVAPSHLLALPLVLEDRVLGVVVVAAVRPPESADVQGLMARVGQFALRLDTALAFDEVRSVATTEERRRVAREIHDGIAQDAAALGYLVDDLSAGAENAGQHDKLGHLRTEVSRLVSELRLSITELRSAPAPSQGLAPALAEHVRRVGSRSSMTVHLSLEETPHRLRPEVEAELLRIAQEAIANAREHSGADNLWVSCRVRPPVARLDVEDDGSWLGQRRDDSYGLRIMRERAESIDADLAITERVGGGTRVSVVLAPPGERLPRSKGGPVRVDDRVVSR